MLSDKQAEINEVTLHPDQQKSNYFMPGSPVDDESFYAEKTLNDRPIATCARMEYSVLSRPSRFRFGCDPAYGNISHRSSAFSAYWEFAPPLLACIFAVEPIVAYSTGGLPVKEMPESLEPVGPGRLDDDAR